MVTVANIGITPSDEPPLAPVAIRMRPRWISETIRIVEWVVAIALSVFIAMGAFNLFVKANEFPMYYHPDEWSKVSQLTRTGYRNFNHPLLMLKVAQQYITYEKQNGDEDNILFAGRRASAALAAGAAFSLTLAGFAVKRWDGLLIAAATCALCPPLLIYAHYLKEDTSLLFGISVTLLGAAIIGGAKGHRRAWIGTAVTGAGVALAASGKYVGIAVAAPAIVAVLMARPASLLWAPLRLILLFAVAVPLGVWINVEAFQDPWTLEVRSDIRNHVEEEYEHATVSHYGVGLTKPNTFLLRTTLLEMMPHLWVMLGLGVAAWLWRRSSWRWPVMVGFFVATFCVVLSENAIPIRRYSLPLTLIAYFTCACAAAYAVTSVRWRWARVGLLVVATGAIGALQYRRCANFNRQFVDDSRQRVRNWIIQNLPPNSRILADQYTHLGHGGDQHRFPNQPRGEQDVDQTSFAGNHGSLEDTAYRYDYVIVSEPSYERFLIPEAKGVDGGEYFFERNKTFHEQLFAKGKVVWESKPEFPSYTYVNPTIRVYDVRALRAERPRSRNQPPSSPRQRRPWPFG